MIGRQTGTPLFAHQPPDWLVEHLEVTRAQEAQAIANTPTQPLPPVRKVMPPLTDRQAARVTPLVGTIMGKTDPGEGLHAVHRCLLCLEQPVTNKSPFQDRILHPIFVSLCDHCQWSLRRLALLSVRCRGLQNETIDLRAQGAELARLLLGDEMMVQAW